MALLRKARQSPIIPSSGATLTNHSLLTAPLGHQFQVCSIVAVVEERLLPAVATLRYVVRQARNHYSR